MSISQVRGLEVRLIRPEEYQTAGDLVVESYIAAGILSDDRGYDLILRDIAGHVSALRVRACPGTGLVSRSRHCPTRVEQEHHRGVTGSP